MDMRKQVAVIVMFGLLLSLIFIQASATNTYAIGEPYVRWYVASPSTTSVGTPTWYAINSTFRIALVGAPGSGWFSAFLYYGCKGLVVSTVNGMTILPSLKLIQLHYMYSGSMADVSARVANYTAAGCNFTYSITDYGSYVVASFSEWGYNFNISFTYHSPVIIGLQLGATSNSTGTNSTTGGLPSNSTGGSNPSLDTGSLILVTVFVWALILICLVAVRKSIRTPKP
jgi:hypothetical protein